ncbi:TetR family transcriptional regulator [Streptomyces sp. NPDC001414]
MTSSRPRRQQQRSIDTRDRILASAGKLFVKDGYEGTTIADIIASARASKQAFYSHFPDGKFQVAKTIMTDTLSMDGLVSQRLKLQEVVDIAMILAHRIANEDALEAALKLSFEDNAPETYGTPWPEWISFNTGQLAEARERGELQPFVDLGAQAGILAGGWSGMVLISKTLDRNMSGVEERVASFYQNVMDAIAIDSVRRKLDISTERGANLMRAFRAQKSGANMDEAEVVE